MVFKTYEQAVDYTQEKNLSGKTEHLHTLVCGVHKCVSNNLLVGAYDTGCHVHTKLTCITLALVSPIYTHKSSIFTWSHEQLKYTTKKVN